ncbi:putative adenosine monophosphate-protein transferase Fic [Enterobacteriaceae bacterium 89]|nr:putative adenosine monophosphate-protein transferase Fic [Enterobacteriaceae bacterium 89]
MKKLPDKQKSRLWEKTRNTNFQASRRLEKGHGPSEPNIETLELGPSTPGLPHLCSLHRHLYRREMKRAGEFRTADISKGDIPFCHFEYIEKMGNELMEALEHDKYLVGLDKEKFTDKVSHYYCEINMLHPFMSGNGISQRIFFEQLAIHAGYVLRWDDIVPEAWNQANQSGAMGNLQPLIELFTKVVNEVAETE